MLTMKDIIDMTSLIKRIEKLDVSDVSGLNQLRSDAFLLSYYIGARLEKVGVEISSTKALP